MHFLETTMPLWVSAVQISVWVILVEITSKTALNALYQRSDMCIPLPLCLPFALRFELHVAVRENRHDLFRVPGDSVAPSV